MIYCAVQCSDVLYFIDVRSFMEFYDILYYITLNKNENNTEKQTKKQHIKTHHNKKQTRHNTIYHDNKNSNTKQYDKT